MKYLLLGYTPAESWDAATADVPSEEALAAFAAYQSLDSEIRATGELVSTEGLGHPAMTTTLRPSGADIVATDAPLAELKEVLASFAVIDVVSHERALEIARRIVEVQGEPVEVRPIMGEDYGA